MERRQAVPQSVSREYARPFRDVTLKERADARPVRFYQGLPGVLQQSCQLVTCSLGFSQGFSKARAVDSRRANGASGGGHSKGGLPICRPSIRGPCRAVRTVLSAEELVEDGGRSGGERFVGVEVRAELDRLVKGLDSDDVGEQAQIVDVAGPGCPCFHREDVLR